ncbi:hypothetical protein GHT06_010205 [Daphnia sinensis]|uniref:Uncharacterized protein n=1 Tax=Daphnia sinensis TaxID=1820382 RepID=A0AAD5LHE6_9CRUS|nr:hypothetical protein GHT06_010205 [Daphnia sinensis]
MVVAKLSTWISLEKIIISLLFAHVFCVSPLPTSNRIAAPQSEIVIDENTEALVKNLRNLGADLKKSVESNNQDLTHNLVNDIKGVWQRIIDKLKPDLYEDLMFYTARLLFLANDRHCESPYETFFKLQCLPIGESKHCPQNQTLIDGPDNKGFCGFKNRSKLRG